MSAVPFYSPAEALARETFLALMWALSYPGRAQALPAVASDPFVAIAETLLDLETSYYTPDAALAAALARTGARALPADAAAYHFYPALPALELLKAASVGTMLYPDTAAALVIGCQFDAGVSARLSGPGIQGSAALRVDLPAAFFELRAACMRYPLGWDVFLVDGARVIGLPRTTMIELTG